MGYFLRLFRSVRSDRVAGPASRRNGRRGFSPTAIELLESRQLLTTSYVQYLADPTILERQPESAEFSQHFAAFDSPQNVTMLSAVTGAESVAPSGFVENGYILTFSTPMSIASAGDLFDDLAGLQQFSPLEGRQHSLRLVPNDPLYPDQWHLANTGQGGGTVGLDANVQSVWDTYRGAGVVIGIVDDGVELTHEDLAANVQAGLHFDWNGNDNDPSPGAGDFHGTAVAGVAAAVGGNGIGVSGAAPAAGIAGLRLIGGPTTDQQEAEAMAWQTNQIDIYSNSWGPADIGRISGIGPLMEASLAQGFRTGRNGLGSIYTWAGGNGGQRQDNVNYDAYANSRYTIAVGALDQNGVRAPYSEPGAPLIVMGYTQGSGIATTTTDITGAGGYNDTGAGDGDPLADINYTSTFNGTSSATPLVSGVIALMLEANPNLTARDVQNILVRTGERTDLGNPDWTRNGAGLWVNHEYGFGAIDAAAAVNMALNYTTLGPEISATTGVRTVNTVIPDGSAVGVSASVDITEAISMEYVEVYLTATHANRGHLDVTLISPSGTRSRLAESRVTDNGANYSRWKFTSARNWAESSTGTWQVQVTDSVTGTTGMFDSFEIVVYGTNQDIPAPEAPAVVSPVGTITNARPTYLWTEPGFAVGYELEVYRGETVVVSQTGLTTNSFTQQTALAEDDYRIRVRAVNEEGDFSEWSAFLSFTVNVPNPSRPVITSPSVDITTSAFPQFAWTANNAVRFTLEVEIEDPATGAFNRVINRSNHASMSYTHFSPLQEASYRARVQAFNSVGEVSAWSEYETFAIDIPTPAKPTVTPAGGTIEDATPRISWNPVEFAYRYDLWVNDLSRGTSQVIRVRDIEGQTHYDVMEPLLQGTYRAWVRAVNGSGEFGPWSDGETLIIDVLTPTRPTVTGPMPGTSGRVETSTPTFEWTVADRAVRYELWVNHDTSSTARIVHETSLTAVTFETMAALPEGNYRAWVRGFNSAGEGGSWSTPLRFTIDVPVPSKPVIVAPVAGPSGSVTDSTPTITWQGEIPGTVYDLWLDDTTDNKSQVIRVTDLDTTSFTVPDDQMLQEHAYTAWVRAGNSAGEFSRWSEPFVFRIDVPSPSTPVIISPVGTVTTATPTFVWQHIAGNARYQILVRDLERMENIVLNVDEFDIDPPSGTASYTSEISLQPGTYRFWIRAFNSQGTASSWSTDRAFSVKLTQNLTDDFQQGLDKTDRDILLTLLDSDGRSREQVAVRSARAARLAVDEAETVREEVTSAVVRPDAAAPAAAFTPRVDDAVEAIMAELADPTAPLALELDFHRQQTSI